MVQILTKEIAFPEISDLHADGIIAVGGDLSPERLLLAYKSGIFPWFGPEDPIIWWSPDPRGIIPIEDFHVSRSLKKIISKKTFRVTVNAAFSKVISHCRTASGRDTARWITDEMVDAYVQLHKLGIAHSVETWLDDELAGGAYGVSVGGLFAGESMFYLKPNASKVALYFLHQHLKRRGYTLFDAQMVTEVTKGVGGYEISRAAYLNLLKDALKKKCVFQEPFPP